MLIDRIKIEKANIEDSLKILDLFKVCFKDDFDKYGDIPYYVDKIEIINDRIKKSIFYKILIDNIIIGVVEIFKKDVNHYYINSICIHPEYQNMGIGQKIVNQIINKHNDVQTWSLYIPIDSFRTRYFFEKIGFKQVDKKLHTDKLTLIKYELTINIQMSIPFKY